MVIYQRKSVEMLNHIALQINEEKDIKAFYEDVLGFEKSHSFQMDAEISARIFEIEATAQVTVITNENLTIELFQSEVIIPFRGFLHTCINVSSISNVVEKCRSKGYEVIEIGRSQKTLYFVKDAAENMFELKAS